MVRYDLWEFSPRKRFFAFFGGFKSLEWFFGRWFVVGVCTLAVMTTEIATPVLGVGILS